MNPLMPIQASVNAPKVDGIFMLLLAVSVTIVLVVSGLIVTFSIRYRRGSKADRGDLPEVVTREFEIGWTVGALFLALFIFWFAASGQLSILVPPANAMEVHVVGKQWMWKVQHAEGAREINALHAPLGRPVRLVMTSQDTIHDFYVPAFRMKQDVLPGRYTQTWFQATRLGTFPIFCAEYCGTDHSQMGGEVTVMTPEAYARWAAAQPQAGSAATRGARLYASLGCGSCHGAGAPGAQAPTLSGLYGARRKLEGGRSVIADEDYLHAALTAPERVRLAGWPPVMPSYARAVDEEGLIDLIAFIKSLGPAGSANRPGAGA